jgi:hypothetical protein
LPSVRWKKALVWPSCCPVGDDILAKRLAAAFRIWRATSYLGVSSHRIFLIVCILNRHN